MSDKLQEFLNQVREYDRQNLCQICNDIFEGNTQTIELLDDKSKIHISGHIKCTDDLFNRIKGLKDYKKMSPSQILKEVNFTI